LSTTELLALIFGHGTAAMSVFDLSSKFAPILEEALTKKATTREFWSMFENQVRLGKVKTHVINAVYELIIRQQSRTTSTPAFTSPRLLAEQFHRLAHKKQEYVYGIYLTPRLTIVHTELLTKGTTDAVSIDIRDVLYFGIKHRVRHFVLIHNHPTGVPTPSREDTEITKRIATGAQLLSMTLLDHIIVAKEGYFSFKESTSML
jgi:DNA repair protein RadC